MSTSTNGRRPTIRLPRASQRKLEDFVQGNRETLENDCCNRFDVAVKAQEYIGQPVNGNHVKAALATMGIKLAYKRPERPGRDSNQGRKRNQVIHQLAIQVSLISDQLGVDCPSTIRAATNPDYLPIR